jgi:hypothetical protein
MMTTTEQRLTTTQERLQRYPAWSEHLQPWFEAFSAFPETDTLTAQERATTTLLIADVQRADDVFQPRKFTYTKDESSRQVANLARSIRRRKRVPMIRVVKAGGFWWVCDGHHRHDAFRAVSKQKPKTGEPVTTLPVHFFVGTKAEAHALSVSENTEDKLPTDHDDKMESAWRMVLLGPSVWSISQVADRAKISERTVANMRGADAKLNKGRSVPLDLKTFTWRQVQDILKDKTPAKDQATLDTAQILSYGNQLGRLVLPLQNRRSIRLVAQAHFARDKGVALILEQELAALRQGLADETRRQAEDQRAEETDSGDF